MGNILQPLAVHLRLIAHENGSPLLPWSYLNLLKSRIPTIIKHFSPTSILLTLRSTLTSLPTHLRAHRLIPWLKKPTPNRPPRQATMSPKAEQKYWEKSHIYNLKLQRTDARYTDPNSGRFKMPAPGNEPPLVMYYTPAPPPPERKENPRKLKRYYLAPRDYWKWHRMVFEGENHPTMAQAARLRSMHDPEELREIHRISRMLPNGKSFKPWTPKYRKEWLKWREARRKALEEYP